MRIEQIRLKNLNSLLGEWEIDLLDKVYRADGIFAITGPTGAGKSTILDAICLALYGRTPRLIRISKSGNEIMSRRTGECYAEICFSTKAGRFRCRWSQRRSRKKAAGELQAPQHEIADLDQGLVLETSIRAVAEQVESISGMDFDRFTRSMLLAQGRFAAFLHSQPDERAPILEQITGTEIYSRISIKTHEHRSAAYKRLELLRANMAGLQLLSDEEEEKLLSLLRESSQRDAALKSQLERKNELIAWLSRVAALTDELRDIAAQRENLQIRIQAFAPLAEKRRLAELALELAGDWAVLRQIRQQLAASQQRIAECQKALPACGAAVEQNQKTLQAAEQQEESAKAEQSQVLPLIRQARELDLKIEEKALPIASVEKNLANQQQNLAELRNKQDQNTKYLCQQQEQLAELMAQMEQNRQDASLPEQVAFLSAEIKKIKKLISERDNKKNALVQQKEQTRQNEQSWRGLNQKLLELRERAQQKQAELEAGEAACQEWLAGKTLSAWQEERLRLFLAVDRFQQAKKIADELQELEKTSVDLQRSQTGLAEEKQRLQQQLSAQRDQQNKLEQEAEQLEQRQNHLQKIAVLEDLRRHLQGGEPCPLCGSLEHPLAALTPPKPEAEQERLLAARAGLKEYNQKISRLEVQRAKNEKELEHTMAALEEALARIKGKKMELSQNSAACSLDLEQADTDPGPRLALLAQDSQKKLGETEQTLSLIEKQEKQKTQVRAELEEITKNLAQATQEVQAACHHLQSAEEALSRLQDEHRALSAEQEQALCGLQEKVSRYTLGIAATDLAKQLVALDALLHRRRDRWIAWQEQKEQLGREVEKSRMEQQHLAARSAKEREVLQQQQQALLELQARQNALIDERRKCFGDQDPEQKERALVQRLADTGQIVQRARQTLETAVQEESRQSAVLSDLERSIRQKTAQACSAEEDFSSRCQLMGFADEAAYTAACLQEEERRSLVTQASDLEREQLELQIRAKGKKQLLAEEREHRLTDAPLETLLMEREALLAEQGNNQENTGALKQQMDANARQKEQKQQQLLDIARWEQECGRRDLLHSLIGSADGKKFRNFAQGLTFERMIALANQQLQKMSDRYLLIRDSRKPLELNVVDSYQAGEIRSTRNLSGGEGFIVSLALALGLSCMVGRRVRMDSLFLDEGFGTLDEEALDIALGALASLRLDGKLIGIISHVPALQDRIGAQIQVRPLRGGRSALAGPGCRRIEKETKSRKT